MQMSEVACVDLLSGIKVYVSYCITDTMQARAGAQSASEIDYQSNYHN